MHQRSPITAKEIQSKHQSHIKSAAPLWGRLDAHDRADADAALEPRDNVPAQRDAIVQLQPCEPLHRPATRAPARGVPRVDHLDELPHAVVRVRVRVAPAQVQLAQVRARPLRGGVAGPSRNQRRGVVVRGCERGK